MASPRSYAIPEGWVMRKKVENDGTEVERFVCLATDRLEFGTYNGMMRYVHFAIAREASVYSPGFSPPKKKASSKRGRRKRALSREAMPKRKGEQRRKRALSREAMHKGKVEL